MSIEITDNAHEDMVINGFLLVVYRDRACRVGNAESVLTPKAFANSSPGLERKRQPWEPIENVLNPERVRIAQA